MRLSLPLFARCWILGALVVGACSSVPAGKSPEPPAVMLRFKPSAGQRFREHWVYDLDAPGSGIERWAYAFDVSVQRLDAQNTPHSSLRYVVRHQYRAHLGRVIAAPDLSGTHMNASWGSDHSLLSDMNMDARGREASADARSFAAGARFGMLIEYPDQPLSVGDSWSIEPRTLTVGPALGATLRPSYTLESITGMGDQRVAVIAADIQVDLVPEVLGNGVIVDGGGTASGSLRVRASDGVVLEARTVLHFNQEVRVQSMEALGYREFSATAHVVTTDMQGQVDLAADPWRIEPTDPDEERACAAQLDAAAERTGHLGVQLQPQLLAALYPDALPTAPFAPAVEDPGSVLLLGADGKRFELDGVSYEPKDLPRALRNAPGARNALYLLAPYDMPIERLRAALMLLPGGVSPRLLVRAAGDELSLPRPSRWLEEQLRAALAAGSSTDRQLLLNQLLVDHLVLCEGALDTYRRVTSARTGLSDLPERILSELSRCGCTTTNLDGLEVSMHALFGWTELRSLRLPFPRFERRLHGLSPTATVQDLVRSWDAAGQDAPE